VAQQFMKDLKRSGNLAQGFPAGHNEREHQDALAFVRETFEAELVWGRLPRVGEMASEADAMWGGLLDGWPDAEPGQPGYDTTLRGFNQVLHGRQHLRSSPSWCADPRVHRRAERR
jgi:hypothetical protein